VVYPIQNLEPGKYTAKLKVWDTHNNSTTTSVTFTVSDKKRIFTFNEQVYPNPIDNNTIFRFEHDREDENLEVFLMIYSSRGDVVAQKELLFENSDRTIEIPWSVINVEKKDFDKGIYYSRLIIQSNFDGAVKEIAQKLVVVN